AYYPRIEKESSKIYVPQWGIEACATYVMMLATTREAMADARYRKFITRTDAGHPQQNPFIPVLKWLKERFYEIVSVHVDDVKPR
ncbi:MAG: hypothetical protein GY869_15205, partial [Planctomycetes bacterium]|nr:hypothetical protein [Planctomycetota bacterium]